MGVDILLQGEIVVRTAGSPTATLLRGPAPTPPSTQVLNVSASWAQRYDEAGIQLPDNGVSQGVLDDDGHERSLVRFPINLPDDVDVSLVRLRVPWTFWRYFNGVGDLVLGWHTHNEAPLDWSVGDGATQMSDHEIRQGPVDLVLGWAATPIESRTFAGLAIGPGYNETRLYAGSTDVDLDEWTLEITYAGSNP